MSKHERQWTIAGPVSPAELQRLRKAGREGDALVRFLATAEDWQAASRRLSGAFAEDEATRLRLAKEE